MRDAKPPLPSRRALALRGAAAAALAAVLLVTVVWPAEFGIDPTGVGTWLGLRRLVAPERRAATTTAAGRAVEGTGRRDSVNIELPAKAELEYKFLLAKGASLDYVWRTSRGNVFASLHGETLGANAKLYSEDFTVSTGEGVKGVLRAPFAGRHGWYWKNDNDFPVTVTLMTSGDYEVIGLLKIEGGS